MSALATRFQSLARWLFRLEQFHFTPWESALLRLIFAWLLIDSLPTEAGVYADTPHPRGLAHFMDLSFMHNANTVHWLSLSAMVCLVIGALGVLEPLTIGWTLFVIIASKSYNTSQGFMGHAGQLHSLCLLAWWLASLWALRGGWKKLVFGGPASWALQIWCILQTITASYTVSAITKLINSGGTWPLKGANFVLQMLKAHQERITSNGVQPGDFAYQAVDVLSHHARLGSALLFGAFLLEFFAFLALLNRRMCLCIGLGLLSFHHSTELLMTIGFATHRQLLWLFLINPLFWAGTLIIAIRAKQSRVA